MKSGIMYIAAATSSTAGYVAAQVVNDPIGGGAGWVGTGLLSMVLSWLFVKHLPAKDLQIKELMDTHATALTKIADAHTAAISKLTDSFKGDLITERELCDKRLLDLNNKLDSLVDFMRTRAEATATRRGVLK